MTIEQIIDSTKQMRLFGICETIEQRVLQARDKALGFEELLSMLFQDETQYRDKIALSKRIHSAKFEELKSFDNFDLRRYKDKTVQAIRYLMTGAFLNTNNHIVIMGPVGTGKTHLGQSLGLMACQKGKKVHFVRANDLLLEFHRSKADETTYQLFKRFNRYDVFIIDDFGLKSLSAEQSNDLYDLIASMHISSCIIFTTNRKIEDWSSVFYDPVMANAAMDRIINNSYRIILDGESYRKKFTPKYDFGGDKLDKKI